MIKRVLRVVTSSWAFAQFATGLERIVPQQPNRLAVLTYHRVDAIGQRLHLSPALHSATPADFAEQMGHLAAHWNVVSMQDLVEVYDRGRVLPPRSVMVTFDDAYRGFAEHAWPVLKRLGLPVTLFVPTSFPDHPERGFWWDRLYQAINRPQQRELETPTGRFPVETPSQRRKLFKALREQVKSLDHEAAMQWIEETCAQVAPPEGEGDVLSWDTLRALAAEGVTLGAHTQTHPLLNRVTRERARDEAVGSLTDLRREIGSTLPVFAYPSGGIDDGVVAELDRAGFRLAFTTERGVNALQRAHPLCLRRINVGQLTPLPMVQVQMLPGVTPDRGTLMGEARLTRGTLGTEGPVGSEAGKEDQ